MSHSHPPLASAAVVVAAYNEEASIGEAIADLRRYFARLVVVDDGSSDATGEIARRAGATTLRHPVNLGQGAALETGIRYAMGLEGIDYFVTFDADGQHQAEDAHRLLLTLQERGFDVVLGTRFVGGGAQLVPPLRRAVLKFARAYSNRVTGLQLTDAHNGLRAFTRPVAADIRFRHPKMGHASEFVSIIAKKGFAVTEEPVMIRYTAYSRKKGQSTMNAINVAFDLFWRP